MLTTVLIILAILPMDNDCVCAECRRARWNRGEDPYGKRGDSNGKPWRPGAAE